MKQSILGRYLVPDKQSGIPNLTLVRSPRSANSSGGAVA